MRGANKRQFTVFNLVSYKGDTLGILTWMGISLLASKDPHNVGHFQLRPSRHGLRVDRWKNLRTSTDHLMID